MKRLKFMLAAAAAIGLSSASQAAYYPGSTNFEDSDYVVGAVVDDNTADELFEFTGTAGDNESTIVGEAVNFAGTRPLQYRNSADTKYLQVSTGTDPLLRKIRGAAESIPAGGAIYTDTLVQFTVTPYTDDVTANATDKLMIYVQEHTNAVSGVVDGTNLVVKAASIDTDPITFEQTIVPTDVIVSNGFDVASWYRLTVKSYVDNGLLLFNIFLDGQQLSMSAPLAGDDVSAFPSLLGGTDLQIAGVGFAGEGKVDDLSFTNSDPFSTTVDFTLEWPNGFTPVSYAIGSGAGVSLAGASSPATINGVTIGDAVAFTFQNADGATKTLTGTAGSDDGQVTSLDASTATFTWADYLGDAVAGAYTIDDFADLDMLRKGVAAGLATAGEMFKQTANIDMTSAGAFAGIGTYADNPTAGVAFCGTYDGQGNKISNVTFTDRDYAGIFNQINGGTVQNLTVENLTFGGTGSKYSASIIGNAGNGATLKNLVATGSFGSAEKPGNHNMAGIAIRLSAGGTGTLVQNCTNNAAIYGTYTKLAGICALTQVKVSGGAVTFDGCANNGALTMPSGSTAGRDGLGGIVAYASDTTVLVNCSNTGAISSTLATAKIGELVGYVYANHTLTDQGGNSGDAAKKLVHTQDGTINGFKYAMVDNDVATTVTTLAAGNTYLLEGNVAASETPVFTLQAAGDTIAFDTALGYTFAGTVDGAVAALGVDSATAGTVTTYTAFAAVAQITGGAKYATLQAAVDAATAGDTIVTLADCTITTPLSIAKNLTVSNDYTIAANVNYALCIGATVTFEGSGMIQRGSTISGSAFCVGANETTRGAITAGTAGTLVFNGGTVCGGNGGNQIKLENGTVEMNGGVLKDGLRGIKADADAGSYTSAIVINGGTITNFSAYAVFASAESATGKATITINGGVIAGPVGKAGKGDETITIPGTSTAKFNADQSAFCASGYETVLSDGWYVVQAVAPSGEEIEPGKFSTATYDSLEAANAALANVTIVAPEAVATNELISAGDKTDYLAMFEKSVLAVAMNPATYAVRVTLTDTAEAALQAEVDADAAEVIEDLSETDVTLTTTPGFYYSFEYGTSLDNMTEVGTRTLATGDTLTLPRPTTANATSGFYKVLVNITAE